MSCSHLRCTTLISGLNNLSCLWPFICFSMPDQPPAKKRRGRPAATRSLSAARRTQSTPTRRPSSRQRRTPSRLASLSPTGRCAPETPPVTTTEPASPTPSPSSLVQPTMAEEVKALQETVASLVSVVQHLATDAARRNTAEEPATVPSERTPSSAPVVAIADPQPPALGGELVAGASLAFEKPRPVLLSAGLQAGASIPDRIKSKIWSDMYVDFYDILHHDQTNTYNMTLSDTGDMPTLQFAPRRKHPLTESEWCSAWDDFFAVYTIKNPQSLCELITYSKTIKDMMRSGSDWRRYDQQFRLDRQHNKCSWAAVRVDLQIAATLANNNRNNQST